MPKNESKKSIEAKIKSLDQSVEWFYSENFSLDQALQKYQDANQLAQEIQQDLSALKNQVEVIADFTQSEQKIFTKLSFLSYNKLMQNDSPFPNPAANPTPAGSAPTAPTPNLGAAAVNATVAGAPSGSIVEPMATNAAAFAPAAPGTAPVLKTATPLASPASGLPTKNHRSVIETVILVVVSLIAVTFIGLFIWKYLEWDNIKTDVDGQIDAAVAVAVSENTTKMENEFIEREKYPYKSFMGPVDYGSVSFEYPKTWNLYIAKDAANGGNYEAYLNPGEVLPVGNATINALRVIIQDKAFDAVAKTYENSVKNGKVSMVTRNIGSTVANVYTGELSNNIRGIVTIIKVRDKTVMLQTDSELFSDEYYKLLDTVNFVE